MGLRKSSSKVDVARHQAEAAAAGLKVQAADARDRVSPTLSDARDRVGPTLSDARDRVAPTVADARDRLAPAVAEARGHVAPVVADAKERLAGLTETVATKLDDALPDDRTPDFVKDASANGRSPSKFTTILALLGLGAVVAFVASKRAAEKEPVWQQPSAAPRPTPAPAAGAAASAATSGPAAADVAGGSPDEAASDAAETAHTPTTPDEPVEVVDIEDEK